MLWEPTRADRDEAFLQIEYGDMLGGLPAAVIANQIYAVDRLAWFGRVLSAMERSAPSIETLLRRGLHGIEAPKIPARFWAIGAAAADAEDKDSLVETRFVHYGSPLEVVLAGGLGVGAITMGFQRVLILWQNFQETKTGHMRQRLLYEYYRQVESNGADAFETPEDYHHFMTSLSLAEQGLQGATAISALNIPPLGAPR